MIFDSLERLHFYGTGELWEKVCSVVQSIDEKHPEGDFSIQGEDAFYRVMSYQTKPTDQCRIEGHREYIDIQFSLAGAEGISVFSANQLQVDIAYNQQDDIEFYSSTEEPSIIIANKPGFFSLLYPWNLHRPQQLCGEAIFVKKAVVKVHNTKID
ncbi:YhcH/YjgK/YiaL family protein [Desulfovibrio sp. OttesenSCG-928-A18]|nr:YhcH/YjgK/YiaL family protein [Desulfovibrio sp. OttesenSCG-928-A18]